jgi:hypothetical protein
MTESGWTEEMEAALRAWESSHWPISSHPELVEDAAAATRAYFERVLGRDESSAGWLARPSSPAQLLLDLTHLDMAPADQTDIDRAGAWLVTLGATPDMAARLGVSDALCRYDRNGGVSCLRRPRPEAS